MISKIASSILVFSALLFPQQDYRIISSDQNSIIIEYTPQYLDSSIQKIDGQDFRNVEFVFGYIDESVAVGMPAIPERKLVIGVPSEFGNTIEILSSVYSQIDGRVMPIPYMEKENFLEGNIYEISTEYYNYQDYPELPPLEIIRGMNIERTIALLNSFSK